MAGIGAFLLYRDDIKEDVQEAMFDSLDEYQSDSEVQAEWDKLQDKVFLVEFAY